jgi:hypothetical protein
MGGTGSQGRNLTNVEGGTLPKSQPDGSWFPGAQEARCEQQDT